MGRSRRGRSRARGSRSRSGSALLVAASRCCCARRELGDRLLDRRGAVGRHRRPAARATSRARCARTARRRCTTCCCTSGCALAGRSEAGRARARRCCSRCSAIPVALWAGRASVRHARAAWIAAVLAAFNPFLTQYAQEARMYSLVALLAIARDCAASCAPTRSTTRPSARRPWIAGFAVSLAAMLYTHNWAIFFALAPRRRVARCCSRSPPAERRRELLRDGAARLRRRARALPAVGADDALPGRPHRRAVVGRARRRRAARRARRTLLGRTPQIVLLLCRRRGRASRCVARRRGRR